MLGVGKENLCAAGLTPSPCVDVSFSMATCQKVLLSPTVQVQDWV